MVTLTNRSGRMLVFVLPHDAYCEAAKACACSRQPGRNGRLLPGSPTLPSGHSVAAPKASLAVPEVAETVRAGRVQVTAAKAHEAPATIAEPPRAAPAAEEPEPGEALRSLKKKRGRP
jgi:hypothetical protein